MGRILDIREELDSSRVGVTSPAPKLAWSNLTGFQVTVSRRDEVVCVGMCLES